MRDTVMEDKHSARVNRNKSIQTFILIYYNSLDD